MTDILEAIAGKSKLLLETDDRLRQIFMEHFEINSEKHRDNPEYKSYATYAVEVGLSIANLFLSIKRPENNRGFSVINDLVFKLNANPFWTKNASILVPCISMGLNAHRDYANMLIINRQAKDYAVYDKLMSGAQAVPLEVFGMLLYLVGGSTLMVDNSLSLKDALSPYFVGN